MRKKSLIKSVVSLLLVTALALAMFGCKNNTNPVAGETDPTTDEPAKRIAFTFDDGPHAPREDLNEGYYPYTTYILDKLEATGARATFFVIGSRAETYPDALRRAVSLGCEIGSHTYEHTTFRGVTDDEIKSVAAQAEAAITAAGVEKPTLFRPMGGSVTEHQLSVLASLGYRTIGWSIDTTDYDGRPKAGDKFSDDADRNATYESFVNKKVELIMSQAKDGAIILMHDIYMSSVDIFCRAADRLIAQGYELVTVSELLGFDGTQTEAVMYLSKDQTATHMS